MKFEKLDPKKVERELGELIEKLQLAKVGITVEWLKEFTYNFDLPTREISSGYFERLMGMLPENIRQTDFDRAIKVFNDVWNSFPQKIIGGVSPQEKMDEGMQKEKNKKTSKHSKKSEQKKGELVSPLNDEFLEKHVENMEKGFKQYTQWVHTEVLPKYEKHLSGLSLDKKISRERLGVAGVFLEVCGHIGIFELSALSSTFITDFPQMFTETVIGPKIPKENIAVYVKDFLLFLDIFYSISIQLPE